MKIFIKASLSLFFLGLIFVASLSHVFASTYGSCVYGSGNYNNANCSSGGGGSSSNSSGSSGGGGGGSGSATCTNRPPSSAPDLFQINTNNTTATLFLAPAGQPYNNYSFSFGTKPAADMYGGGFNQQNSTGVISFTINFLKPNTIYYFKINAGNGCAGGPTSSVVVAKTTSSKKIIAKYYKSRMVALISSVGQIFKQDRTTGATKVQNSGSSFPSSPTNNNKPQSNTTNANLNKTQKATPAPVKKNILNSVAAFFRGLF